MNKIVTILFCFLYFHYTSTAQTHTLYGSISDKENGEFLIGATVTTENQSKGTVSNSYGFYSLTLPDGTYNISVSFMGYKTTSYPIRLFLDTIINIELQAEITELDEVIVKAEKNDIVANTEMGSKSLNLNSIKLMPCVLGEVDLVKSLQFLPGIQTTNEGTTNLSVRGGSFDQNLFLLDDAPVYNPSHALGFFSTFNPDAINNVKIYKTVFPAGYGGRLSSIIDIRMKEGNNKTFKCNGGVGLIASRLSVEGPLIKDKASFIISGRYSYTGFMANSLGSLGQELYVRGLRDFNNNNEIFFYDFNAKVNYKINTKNHFYLSAYSGKDHFYYYSIDDKSSMDWGNITGTMRWNHLFSSKLFSNSTLLYSKYNYAYILKDDIRHFRWSSDMEEIDIKSDFDYLLNFSNRFKFGIALESHKYSPGEIEPRDTASITKAFSLNDQRAILSSFYVNNEHKINNKINLGYGLRYSAFFLLGENTVYSYSPDMTIVDSVHYGNGELVQFYNGLEPRVVVTYMLNEENSLKLSYTYAKQYQHLVSNSSVGLPTDLWLPVSKYIKPQYSGQYVIGYYKTFSNVTYEFFTEMYYRKINNIIDYKDNADLFLNPHIETQVLPGKGRSYGIELFLEKKAGKLTGWISYTLSNTKKQVKGINNDASYPASYDKRHNLSTVYIYSLSQSWKVSSTFKFTSGGYTTIPEGTFYYYGASFNYYTKRNGYKLPPYHRLDIALSYKNQKKQSKKWKTEWNFGIYNLYGRKNIFTLFIKQDNNYLESSKAYKMYLYGITPYLTFNFSF